MFFPRSMIEGLDRTNWSNARGEGFGTKLSDGRKKYSLSITLAGSKLGSIRELLRPHKMPVT